MDTIKTHDLTPAPRKRALPRVWKRFYQLKKGEAFDLPGKGSVVVSKIGFFTADAALGYVYLVAPWKRVRTTTLVRDTRPGGKTGPEPVTPIPFSGVFDHSVATKLRLAAEQTGPSA